MTAVLNLLILLSLSIEVGGIVFFSFIIAPTVFRELPKEIAGEFIGKLFPFYYLVGYAALGIALICLCLKGVLSKPFPIFKVVLVGMMFSLSLYAGLVIQPKAHLIKTTIKTMEEGPLLTAKQKEFSKTHLWSVILNLAVLGMGLAVLEMMALELKR